MKNHARLASAIAITLLISLSAIAQQPKKRTPSMSTDDVVRPGSSSGASSGEWTRYSPGDSAFSLELPGQPQPIDLPLPPAVQNELQSANGYVYTNGRAVVVIAHFVPKKGSTAASQLKDFASQMARGTKGAGSASVKVIDDSTVLISEDVDQGGGSQHLEGMAKSVGGTVWMIVTIYQQGDESGQALARRVIDSAIFE
ncbi:MAG TPA: hypothetical protein VID27_13050 [Blastocatellia bacterium]|jgi:hypothetical protein